KNGFRASLAQYSFSSGGAHVYKPTCPAGTSNNDDGMERQNLTQKRLANLRGLSLTVAVGSLALGWGVVQSGPWFFYPLGGLRLGATAVTANAEDLVSDSGWKGVLLLAAATVLWLPLFFVLVGVFVRERHAEVSNE